MAQYNSLGYGEGFSQGRPPLFEGKNFQLWKGRFETHAKAQGFKIWKVISEGPLQPKHADPKLWDDKDEETFTINARAKNLIESALWAHEYSRVSRCETAKEIWDKLLATHEGTTQMKDNRTDELIAEFESFHQLPGEKIIEMETRFTQIRDELKSLGVVKEDKELVKKLMKGLGPQWQNLAQIIRQMNPGLTNLKLENLIETLRTEEAGIFNASIKNEEENKRNITAFKALMIKDDSDDEEGINDDIDALNDDEAAFLSRQARNFIHQKAKKYGKNILRTGSSKFRNTRSRNNNLPIRKGNFHQQPYKPEEAKPSTSELCYQCNKPGHFKKDCPNLPKGRSFVVDDGWGLSDDEEDIQPGESSQQALMAHEIQEVNSPSTSYNIDDSHNSQDQSEVEMLREQLAKLQSRIKYMVENTGRLAKDRYILINKNKDLIKQNEVLAAEKAVLEEIVEEKETQNETLLKATEELNVLCCNVTLELKSKEDAFEKEALDLQTQLLDVKKERDDLSSIVLKFTKGEENFRKLLGKQGCSLNKEGLGYQKTHTELFCNYCKKPGHHIRACRKRKQKEAVYQWIPKIPDPTSQHNQSQKIYPQKAYPKNNHPQNRFTPSYPRNQPRYNHLSYQNPQHINPLPKPVYLPHRKKYINHVPNHAPHLLKISHTYPLPNFVRATSNQITQPQPHFIYKAKSESSKESQLKN